MESKIRNIIIFILVNTAFFIFMGLLADTETILVFIVIFIIIFVFGVATGLAVKSIFVNKNEKGTKKFFAGILIFYSVVAIIYLIMKLGDVKNIGIYKVEDFETVIAVVGFLFTMLGTFLSIKSNW